VDCFYCNYSAEEPKLIAQHIVGQHPSKHNKWAAKVLTNVEWLNKKADSQSLKDRVPLTDEEKASKKSTQRQLSGIEKNTFIHCPSCQQTVMLKLPVEYLQSPYAWRSQNKLVVNCLSCRRG
jgi:hypothetical protein